ncbi:uncharacterized protein LOC143127421 isoform X1 [Alosa pseudoharengus]|uniref:uncharacterized protein LOC143127421 isoform X1 n=1 Tax=Alosa pseudoharengus TaxID=34774 RepID=UPI003F89AC56
MSEHPLYAVINHHQKHTSCKTSSETTDDDATYSNIHISVPGRSALQKGDRGSDCVIYTKVSLPNQDDAQPTEASDPDDPSPRTAPEERSLWRVLLKPTVLLLFLSALLIIVIFTLSAFYSLSEISYAETLYDFQKSNTDAWNSSGNLQKELMEIKNELVELQSKHNSLSEEKALLWHQLNETQMNLTGLLRNYTVLSREKTDTLAKLDSLKAEVRDKLAKGWKYFSGKWYYFSTSKNTWDDSRQRCVTMGGHLVIIESKEEQQFLNGYKDEYWIGLHCYGGSCTWVDNTLLTNPEYWKPGTLKSNTYYSCMKTSFSTWLTTRCEYKNRHICECKAIA